MKRWTMIVVVAIVSFAVAHNSFADVVTNGLVSWWKLNETSGLSAIDSGPAGNDGTLEGYGASPSWTNDTRNSGSSGSLEFDGTDDYIDCGNDSSLDITNAITLEAWFKLDTLAGDMVFLGRGRPWSAHSESYGPYSLCRSGTTVYFFLHDTTYTRNGATYNGVSQTGVWYHAVGTWDGSSDIDALKLYINGALVSQSTLATTNNTYITTRHLNIGRYPESNYVNGKIDEVRIYNRALSAAEVVENYRAISTNTAGLVATWKMEEGAGTDVFDENEWNNDGTMQGFTAPYGWTSSSAGSASQWALSLDGTNDYIDCGNDGSLNITGAISITAWVNLNTNTISDGAMIVSKGYPWGHGTSTYGPYALSYYKDNNFIYFNIHGTDYEYSISSVQTPGVVMQ